MYIPRNSGAYVSFCKLLAMYVLEAFMPPGTPKPKNIGLLILCNSIMLE